MKKKILVANWKMQLSPSASQRLARQFVKSIPRRQGIIICPDFLSLPAVGKIIKGHFSLGAQNLSSEVKGPYTGQESALSLKESGAKYVILGHSEARRDLGETDSVIKKKLISALNSRIKPILCVGEKTGEKAEVILRRQLNILRGLKINPRSGFIIAYEPVWAIGKGQALDAKKANELQAMIKLISYKYLGFTPVVLYGGSVDKKNIKEFSRQPYIDGCLAGGASLKVSSFNSLVKIIFSN